MSSSVATVAAVYCSLHTVWEVRYNLRVKVLRMREHMALLVVSHVKKWRGVNSTGADKSLA